MSKIVDKYKKMNSGNKLIVGSFIIAVISLFLPWIETGGHKLTGLEQLGYFFLLFFIYPLYKILREEEYDSKVGMVSGLIMIILSILYNRSKNLGIFSKEVNTPAIGLYIFVIGAILFTFGNRMNRPLAEDHSQDEDPDQKDKDAGDKKEELSGQEAVASEKEPRKEEESKEVKEEVSEEVQEEGPGEKQAREEESSDQEPLEEELEKEASKEAETEAVKDKEDSGIIDMTDDSIVDDLQK